MRHCQIKCNFGGIDDLCKLGKEYLIALTCKLRISRYNRGIYRHRIANFPNYVTLTSSLTHHRIVNLGAHGATGTVSK